MSLSPPPTLQIPAGWRDALAPELEKPYFQTLAKFVAAERAQYAVYPPPAETFSALQATTFADVRVLILGQDPYHGPGQAHGMAFSVRPGAPPPPSLVNIYKELKSDLGIEPGKDGHLMPWAKQGVLLLNAVLTVRSGQANSHKNRGWETFTDAVIKAVAAKPERVVFILWGAYAGKKAELINPNRHTILKSAHPSPLSAYNGFFGSKPFSRTNEVLGAAGEGEIDWRLG